MLAASSSSQREHEDDEVRRKEREFFQKLSRPIQELDGLALLMEDHKKSKLLEEEDEEEFQANMAMEQATMDESHGPIGHENTRNGDGGDSNMTRNDYHTPPKRKSPASKRKQTEQGETGDAHCSNEPVSAVDKSTQSKKKRVRSK